MSCYLCRRKAGIRELVEKTIVIAMSKKIIGGTIDEVCFITEKKIYGMLSRPLILITNTAWMQ